MVVADSLEDAGDVAKALREVADPTKVAVERFKEKLGIVVWFGFWMFFLGDLLKLGSFPGFLWKMCFFWVCLCVFLSCFFFKAWFSDC